MVCAVVTHTHTHTHTHNCTEPLGAALLLHMCRPTARCFTLSTLLKDGLLHLHPGIRGWLYREGDKGSGKERGEIRMCNTCGNVCKLIKYPTKNLCGSLKVVIDYILHDCSRGGG